MKGNIADVSFEAGKFFGEASRLCDTLSSNDPQHELLRYVSVLTEIKKQVRITERYVEGSIPGEQGDIFLKRFCKSTETEEGDPVAAALWSALKNYVLALEVALKKSE